MSIRARLQRLGVPEEIGDLMEVNLGQGIGGG
jgi:hypothetical protein